MRDRGTPVPVERPAITSADHPTRAAPRRAVARPGGLTGSPPAGMRTPGPPTGIPGPPEPRSPSAAPPAPLTGAPGRDDRPFLAAEAARSRAPAGGAAVSGGTSRASRRTNPVRQARPRSADRRPRPQHRPHRGTGPRRSSSPGRRGAGAGSPYRGAAVSGAAPREVRAYDRTGRPTSAPDPRTEVARPPGPDAWAGVTGRDGSGATAEPVSPRGGGLRPLGRTRTAGNEVRPTRSARAHRAPGRRQVAAVARGHLAHGRGRPAREVARGGGHSTPMSRTAPCLPPW